MSEPKYPLITVPLSGQDGNAFLIVTRVSQALRDAGIPTSEINQYKESALSGDYGQVLAATGEWVTVR